MPNVVLGLEFTVHAKAHNPGKACSALTAAACAALTLAALAAAFILAGGGWAAVRGGWSGCVASAIGSRLFITCLLVCVGCLAALSVLWGVMWQIGRARRVRAGGQEGSAILEFALVLPIALMLVMLMTQSSLLMGGNLCVHYAAFCAARSAVVQVPRRTDAEPPNQISGDAASSAKMKAIFSAAVWALMPVSCGSTKAPCDGTNQQDGQDLQKGLTQFFAAYGKAVPGWATSRLGTRLQYARDHTSISLDPAKDPQGYGAGEDLHVSLSHTFYMSVPYAAYVFYKLTPDGEALNFGTGEYGLKIGQIHTAVSGHAPVCHTMINEGSQDYVDIEQFAQGLGP